MNKKNILIPKICYWPDYKTFNLDEEDIHYAIKYYNDFVSSEKNICKIQDMDDLKKTKYILPFVIKDENGDYGEIGKDFELFIEDNEIKIKTMKRNDKLVEDVKVFETSLGLMYCIDRGEWGGGLYLYHKDKYYRIGDGNYRYVVENNNEIFAVTSLAHLGLSRFELHEIRMRENKVENWTLLSSHDMIISACCAEDEYFYFYSDGYDYQGLYRFDLVTLELELLSKNEYDLEITSLIKKDNIIYYYGDYNIIKYDLDTDEYETYTNLEYEEIDESMFLCDEKLIDVWDKFIEE